MNEEEFKKLYEGDFVAGVPAPTHYCPRCGTVYFAEGECDWCPHVQLYRLAAKPAEELP